MDLPSVFVVQRCKHYGYWPELEQALVAPVRIPSLNEQGLNNATFRFGYRSYGNHRALNEPPMDIRGDVILLVSLGKEVGFSFGDKVYIEGNPGDAFTTLIGGYPKQGEVDLLIAIDDLSDDIGIDDIYAALLPYISTLVLYMSGCVGDFLIPSGRAQAFKQSDSGWQCAKGGGANLFLTPRPIVETATLVNALGSFSQIVQSKVAEEVVSIEKAARRIINAQQENDIIDAYCDLWEACEFLCIGKKRAIDGRITQALSDFTKNKYVDVWANVVSPIYKIRCDLVHNAVEEIDRCKRALPIL
jgi:hypothetical protein